MVTQISETQKKRIPKIPANLIREVVNGTPFYYKGYKNVMNGKQQLEGIMGSSSLQSYLVGLIYGTLFSLINRKKYSITTNTTNEAGLHLGHKNNFSTDNGIFLKEKIVLNDKYFKVAPEIAIEVDVKIDSEHDIDYVFSKSEEMMKFGTEKVLWVLTKHKKVMVFAKNETTFVFDWNKDVAIMEGIIINIQNLLEQEGIETNLI